MLVFILQDWLTLLLLDLCTCQLGEVISVLVVRGHPSLACASPTGHLCWSLASWSWVSGTGDALAGALQHPQGTG